MGPLNTLQDTFFELCSIFHSLLFAIHWLHTPDGNTKLLYNFTILSALTCSDFLTICNAVAALSAFLSISSICAWKLRLLSSFTPSTCNFGADDFLIFLSFNLISKSDSLSSTLREKKYNILFSQHLSSFSTFLSNLYFFSNLLQFLLPTSLCHYLSSTLSHHLQILHFDSLYLCKCQQ